MINKIKKLKRKLLSVKELTKVNVTFLSDDKTKFHICMVEFTFMGNEYHVQQNGEYKSTTMKSVIDLTFERVYEYIEILKKDKS